MFLQLRKLSLSRVRRVQLTGSLQPAKNGGGGCFLLCENVRRANKNRTVAINGGWRRQRIRLKALEAIMKVNITLRIFHPSCSSLVTACKGVRHLATLTHTWGGYPGPIVLKKKKDQVKQAGKLVRNALVHSIKSCVETRASAPPSLPPHEKTCCSAPPEPRRSGVTRFVRAALGQW